MRHSQPVGRYNQLAAIGQSNRGASVQLYTISATRKTAPAQTSSACEEKGVATFASRPGLRIVAF